MSQSADQGTGAATGTAIAVTGVGLVTPAGADEHSFWEGLCSGHSTARHQPELAGLPVDFACPVDSIDLDEAVGGRSVWRMARFVKLAVVAARQAVADAGLDPAVWDGGRVGVVLGVGVGGVSVLVDNAAKLAASGPEAVSPLLVPMMIPNAAAGRSPSPSRRAARPSRPRPPAPPGPPRSPSPAICCSADPATWWWPGAPSRC